MESIFLFLYFIGLARKGEREPQAMRLWTWRNSAPDLSLQISLLLLASLLLSQDHTMSSGCWQFLGSWVPVYSYRLLWLHISSWDNLISKYHQVYSLWSDKSCLFFSFQQSLWLIFCLLQCCCSTTVAGQRTYLLTLQILLLIRVWWLFICINSQATMMRERVPSRVLPEFG